MKQLNWSQLTILVAEDEEDLRQVICTMLELEGSKVFGASNGDEAFEILQRESIDIVISDVQMPYCTGMQLLERVKSEMASAPAMFLVTGYADVSEQEALKKGALSLIHKPFNIEKLKKQLSDALLNQKNFFKKF